MSYNPTEWTNGDVITAEKLNKIEEGIVNAPGYTDGIVSTTLFEGAVEYNEAYIGQIPKIIFPDSEEDTVTVVFNGVTYNGLQVKSAELELENVSYVGATLISDVDIDWSEYPFVVANSTGANTFVLCQQIPTNTNLTVIQNTHQVVASDDFKEAVSNARTVVSGQINFDTYMITLSEEAVETLLNSKGTRYVEATVLNSSRRVVFTSANSNDMFRSISIIPGFGKMGILEFGPYIGGTSFGVQASPMPEYELNLSLCNNKEIRGFDIFGDAIIINAVNGSLNKLVNTCQCGFFTDSEEELRPYSFNITFWVDGYPIRPSSVDFIGDSGETMVGFADRAENLLGVLSYDVDTETGEGQFVFSEEQGETGETQE